MSAGTLVVVDVRGEDAAQMALVEDHDVIQTLAANRTDHALDVRVLPGRSWRRDDLCDRHRLDPFCRTPSRTRRRDRAVDSAAPCPTGTLRLPGAITKPL